MKITLATGENFCSLEKVEFKLTDQGLVGLVGDNQDDTSATSNGAGKSSLPDLLCWVLWGTTARGSKGDSIIRRGEKQAGGEVYLEDGDEEWKIGRKRQKGKETLTLVQCKPTLTDHTLGTNPLTQALIAKILGCTEDVFRAAIYVGQEDLPDLPAMTDKQLKEMIERAAGVDVLERALKLANERANAAQKALDDALVQVKITDASLTSKNQALIDAQDNERIWIAELENNLHEIDHDIARDETDKTALEAQLAAAPDISKLNKAVPLIQAKLAGIKAEQDEERRLSMLAQRAQASLDQAQRDLDRQTRLVAGGKAELGALQGRVGTPCPECGSTLTHDHLQNVEAAINARIQAAEQAEATARAQLATAQAAQEAAAKTHADYVATMSDPTTLNAQNTKLAVALRDRVALDERYQRHCRALSDLKAKRHSMFTRINPHTAQIATIEGQIIDLKTKLDAAKTLEAEKDTALQHAKLVQQVFGPAGVRAHMLDEVTPYLNNRTADYLSIMSDGNITAEWSTLTKNKKGEYKERFQIDVAYNGGGTFTDLSGGQKRKVRIACALALQDLVASRASKPFDLWICDEIDTALDTAGLERLMMVLGQKAKERGTVIAISHSDLRDWISTIWKVTLKDGRSTLETV